MKKLILIALLFVPSQALADRLGSLRSSADVLLSTQASVSGSTNACGMYLAANSSAYFYNRATETLMVFDTIDYQYGCTADISGASITIATAGMYLIEAAGGSKQTTTGSVRPSIYINGSRHKTSSAQDSGSGSVIPEVVDIVPLNVGDIITAYIHNSGAGSVEFAPNSASFKIGCRLYVIKVP